MPGVSGVTAHASHLHIRHQAYFFEEAPSARAGAPLTGRALLQPLRQEAVHDEGRAGCLRGQGLEPASSSFETACAFKVNLF